MSESANLGLPFLEAGQAQKHVTHNEALRILDAVTQLAVIDVRNAPPDTPEEGARHIVGSGPSGAFAGHANHVAAFQDGAWMFLPPRTGWRAWNADEEALLVWTGSEWTGFSAGGGGGEGGAFDPEAVEYLYINGADPGEDSVKLAVRANDVLLHALEAEDDGNGDMRLQLSKEGEGDTASVFFSQDFSGRAEFGLVGGDEFKLKVSADGSSWVEALIADPATGGVATPQAFDARGKIAFSGDISPSQITANQNDYNPTGLSSAAVLRLSTDASRNLTGLAGGGDGRTVVIQNIGSHNLVLLNQSGGSSAANRFALAANITLTADQCAVLQYDAGASRWRALAAPSAATGGGGDLSPLHLTIARLQMSVADLANAPVNWIGAISDSFDGTSGLDTGGSTALDTSEAGAIKPTSSSGSNQLPTMTAATTSGVTMSATTEYSGSYAAWKAADGNAGSWWVANGAVPQDLDTDFGSGNAKTIASYKMRARNDGTPLGPTAWELRGSNDGSSWTTLDSRTSQSFTSGEQKNITVASPASYRYYRLAVSATGGGSNLSLGEYELLTGGSINNMTAISAAFDLPAEPDAIDFFFILQKSVAMTPGTDYAASVSIDGGSNFDAGSIEELGTVGALTVCRAASIDVSARSGTSLRWKIETFNNKNCKIHDMAARAY
jgi:hypothetical protein